LAAGADVNAKNRAENTPLHYAAVEGRKEIAELLIAKGADVNARDKYGGTPLHYAEGDKISNNPKVECTAIRSRLVNIK